MSEAKLCDRCGKVISFLNSELIKEKEAWRYEIIRDCHPYPDKITIDLCLDCKKDLVKWLGTRRANE